MIEQISKYFRKSPDLLDDRIIVLRPLCSRVRVPPRIPRTKAEVLPLRGFPWMLMKLFWPDEKADITRGTTLRCISNGLSNPYCRNNFCICSVSVLKIWLKSFRIPTSDCSDDSEEISTVISEHIEFLPSVESEFSQLRDSLIVGRKLSSLLPLRSCLPGRHQACPLDGRGFASEWRDSLCAPDLDPDKLSGV